MAGIEKVKVLVLGDSGVGKTSLVHLIAHNEPIASPAWTVGASVEVKIHEYKEGTPHQKMYFVELWDIGGSSSHRNTRPVFYNSVHGVILVHDLTNRKSKQNLKHWLCDVMSKESGKGRQYYDEFDSEQFAGLSMLPMIVIGTKLDLAGEKRINGSSEDLIDAQDWGADKINLKTTDARSLAPGSSSAVKLSRFFDKVIEINRKKDALSPQPFSDKRRPGSAFSPPVSVKIYHD